MSYLPNLKIELQSDKTKIHPLRNGITFLGYRIFYHYTLLGKRNLRQSSKKLGLITDSYNNKGIIKDQLINRLNGFFGYAIWANTYNLRKEILKRINSSSEEISTPKDI